ncbi:hypothetical protein [Bradyrhizobium sp. 2S1]|uniref:hypothetical protein n=1 Tax=Bradyrhizobium sp. 2S1 TaxID=1404429 RepID=UPI0014083BB8|nr:hypothetical protein [Bradyrhizobium sp. 2S1]MCK7666159.1 hypothetical protein [Bradyrhizobium sp. 2S1]
MAEESDWPLVRRRLTGLYGEKAIFEQSSGLGARTGNGNFVVMSKVAVEASYAALPEALAKERRPACVAIHVSVSELEPVRRFVDAAGAPHQSDDAQIGISDAASYGNVFLTFARDPRL